MKQEWIRDRRPTAADGDMDGDVRMKSGPGGDSFHFIHWSYVGAGVPWQRTGWWEPPTEPTPTEADRIAALERKMKEHIRAQSVLAAALVKRLEALEGVPPDGAVPAKVPGGLLALEQRVEELGRTTARLALSTADALESLRAQP